MSQAQGEPPVAGGVCEKCGMGTHLNHEGKTACDGCDKPTMMCACEGQD